MNRPSIILTRFASPPDATMGRLEIGGPVYKIYATLEPFPFVTRPGVYPLVWEYSHKFKRHLWELKNVPGHTEIKIHHGNTNADTEGCILLGRKHGSLNGKTAVLSSRRALEDFCASLSQWQNLKLEIEIT